MLIDRTNPATRPGHEDCTATSLGPSHFSEKPQTTTAQHQSEKDSPLRLFLLSPTGGGAPFPVVLFSVVSYCLRSTSLQYNCELMPFIKPAASWVSKGLWKSLQTDLSSSSSPCLSSSSSSSSSSAQLFAAQQSTLPQSLRRGAPFRLILNASHSVVAEANSEEEILRDLAEAKRLASKHQLSDPTVTFKFFENLWDSKHTTSLGIRPPYQRPFCRRHNPEP